MGYGQWAEEKTTDTLMRVSCLYIQPIANRQYSISRKFCRQRTGVCDQGTAQAMQDYAWT